METPDFEWDDDKADRVWRERGISFWSAAAALDDRYCVELDDETPHEYRWKTVGMAEGQLLTVVSAAGHVAPLRIITVWYATPAEQHIYWKANEGNL
jgi:uncharacterized DUF497 family protein